MLTPAFPSSDKGPNSIPRRVGYRWRRILSLIVLPAAVATCVSEEQFAPRYAFLAGPTAAELLQNPNFEAGTVAWQNSDSIGRAIDGTRVHGGLLAQRILASGLTDYAVYQEVPVTAGETYDAAGWVATDSLAGPGAILELLWLDTLGLTDTIPPAHLLGTDLVGGATGSQDWTLLAGTFTAPAGSIGARVQLRVALEPGDTGSAVFDDLSLTLPPPPPDVTPPTVALTSPLPGDTVQHTILLEANATDDGLIAGVQFQVDGIDVGTEVTQPPHALDYNTDTLANGSYTINALARDTAGNTATSAAVSIVVANPPPKDVLVILTDDQRFDQMQYMPLTTALLNAETVRFNRGFVTTSLCCPSRASILSGLYVHNHGVKYSAPPEGGAIGFDPTSTVATWLHDAGYRTAIVGKYLNEYDDISPAIPPGWDNFEAVVTGGPYSNYTLNRNGTLVSYGATTADYSTDVYAGRAAQFILAAPSRQPIFLFFAPDAPHAPATPHPQDVGSFASFPNWRPPSFNEANVNDKPTWVKSLQLISASRIATSDALHRSMLESLQSVDRAVASIIGALQQTGRWDNTLVVFTSDNGLMWGEHRLRDTKVCPYEECIRVPFWVRIPGVLARTDTNLVANIDLAPTLAAWAGVTPPVSVNGRDLLPLLQNPATAWRTELLIEHFGGETLASSKTTKISSGVRTSRYLYNEYQNGNREFYDLQTDPYQLTNAVNWPVNAPTVASLKTKLNLLKLQ